MELLAALIFGVIIFGFTMLMLVPLFFAWLMVAVYREPWPATGAEPPAVDTEPPPDVEEQLERPKVMVAGRRRPLP
jgi:hypothetical protein